MKNFAEELRGIAQNDYMIDDAYLPNGNTLLKAARHIEGLESDLLLAREEIDALDELEGGYIP